MADQTKVYTGGIPGGGFDVMQGGTAYSISNEAESKVTPGDADAADPKIVNQGGVTQPKTYNKSASEDFLLGSSYKTSMEAGRPGASKTVNPDDISHADSC